MYVLPYPRDADDSDDAHEVLRAWVIDSALSISIAPSMWSGQPSEWGRLLAEAAGHMADAIAKETGRDRGLVLAEIQRGLTDNLENPGTLSGEFYDRTQ